MRIEEDGASLVVGVLVNRFLSFALLAFTGGPAYGGDDAPPVFQSDVDGPRFAIAADEADRLTLETTACPCASGRCEVRSDVGCAVEALFSGNAAKAKELADAQAAELLAPLATFANPVSPAVTWRGVFGIALQHSAYTDVVIGEVESASYEFMEHPEHGGISVMTWCTIRVLESFRGATAPGDAIDVLFDGGQVEGVHVAPSHAPPCSLQDIGIFSVWNSDGLPRASERATVSIAGTEHWRTNWLVERVADLALEIDELNR